MATESRHEKIVQRLQELRSEIEAEINRLLKEERVLFHYTVERTKVRFEEGVKKLHRQQRISSLRYILRAPMRHLVTVPVISSLIVPLVLLDLTVSFYQWFCFPLYGIPKVARRRYVVVDRHQLSYLNAVEKLNCVYCGYGNGVLNFAREIAARTEQYWCPIKHARRAAGATDRQNSFVGYGDAEHYRERLQALRKQWDDNGGGQDDGDNGVNGNGVNDNGANDNSNGEVASQGRACE